ncbi:MAG: fucose isomerase [Planctomycetota bacterium]
MAKTVYLIANGDLRPSANKKCEPAQQAMEKSLIAVCKELGANVKRAHGFRKDVGHSFIDSQKHGREVFADIPKDAPLIVAEAVWQYSHHVLSGLIQHEGPIVTVANWSGTWPGLVGMLNLNGSLTKAGVKYDSLWSEDFATDDQFKAKLSDWLAGKPVRWNTSHSGTMASKLKKAKLAKSLVSETEKIGSKFAEAFRASKPIMGVFDEGCMGMFNAIVPDHLLNPTGVFKERLSQSALYYAMTQVSNKDAKEVFDWYVKKGVNFHFGKKEKTELTKAQVLEQCKMYIASMRIADEFGCDTIGIQYQQGLKDLAPASDLVEGTLNNKVRPPVKSADGKRVLYKGEALPHFNEVDECAGLDGLVTYRLWKELGYAPENTLHDLRWGRHYTGPGKDVHGKKAELDDYVWVLEISGAAPPAHFIGGWKGTHSHRQPPMYFRLGGGTCSGVSKPGHVVWSRVFVEGGKLKMDIGLADVVGLPRDETQDRLDQTTPQWPIMHAVLRGTTRDQMMAKHKSNHIQVVYAPDEKAATRGLLAKAHAMAALGLDVNLCGDIEPRG